MPWYVCILQARLKNEGGGVPLHISNSVGNLTFFSIITLANGISQQDHRQTIFNYYYQNLFNCYWRISTNPDTSKKKEPPETYAGVFYGPTELIYEEK